MFSASSLPSAPSALKKRKYDEKGAIRAAHWREQQKLKLILADATEKQLQYTELQLQKANEQIKELHEIFTSVNSVKQALEKENAHLRAKVAQMNEILARSIEFSISLRLRNNVIALLKFLPQNSPLRLPLIKILTQNITVDEANTLGISKDQYCRAKKGNTEILSLRYAIQTKRKRIEITDLQAFQNFVDTALPCQSGRNYRVMEMTMEHLYDKYIQFCNTRGLVAFSKSFVRKLLKNKKQFKIHHIKSADLCPHCTNLRLYHEGKYQPESKNELQKLITHAETWLRQRKIYNSQVEKLASGQMPQGTGILVLDFTQMVAFNFLTQDFIVHKRVYDPFAPTKLGYTVRQFLPKDKASTNDINFVECAIMKLHEEGFFNDLSTVIIWTDGGGKHFKMTGTMYLWFRMAKITGKTWDINFFSSYHGHAVADNDAAHSKQKVTSAMRNERQIVNSPEKIVEILSTLPHTKAQILPVENVKVSIRTWAGIKALHRIVFNPQENPKAYYTSNPEETALKKTKTLESLLIPPPKKVVAE